MKPRIFHKTSEKRLKYLRDYRKKNRVKETERKRRWYKRNPEKRKAAYKRNRSYIRNRYNSDLKFREYIDLRNLKSRIRIRSEILDLLGNKCVRCGFSDPRALETDHVQGGGNKDRRENGCSRRRLLEDIKKNPKKYQLLCSNCNAIKRYENGEWNHRKEKGQCTPLLK